MPVERPVHPAGAHGGDGLRLAAALGLDPATVIDLSASLNPFAPDAQALAAELLRTRAGVLTAYPDPGRATTLVAAAMDIDPDRIVLTNGGAEAIALVAAAQPVGSLRAPEFSLYRRHLTEVRDGAPTWRSNPSNPLGHLAPADEHAAVWDEAFYPLATGRWTRGDEPSWRLGSLTKLWACPGLRLGYVIAPSVVAARALAERQPQWSLNGLAAALVPELLAQTDLDGWAKAVAAQRRRLVEELRSLGLTVQDTTVNWVLVTVAATVDLRARLAPLGVVVRDCASFGLAGTFRIAVPRPNQLDRVVSAVAAVWSP